MLNADGSVKAYASAGDPIADDPATTSSNELEVAIQAFVDASEAASVDTAETAAATAVADAQADIDSKTGALSSARATTFTTAGGDAATVGSAGLEGISSTTYMTDANLTKAVTEAQAEVDAATAEYISADSTQASSLSVAEGSSLKVAGVYVDGSNVYQLADDSNPAEHYVIDTGSGYVAADGSTAVTIGTTDTTAVVTTAVVATTVERNTASELQGELQTAENTLVSDRGADGSDEQVLKDLRSELSQYVENGGSLSSELLASGDAPSSPVTATIGGSSVTLVASGAATTVADMLNSLNAVLETATDAEFEAASEALIQAFVDNSGSELASAFELSGEAEINSAALVIADRGDKMLDVENAETAFESTDTGNILTLAEGLVEAREEQKTAITEAEADKLEADAYKAEVDALAANYDQAESDLTDAQDLFENLPVTIDGNATATADQEDVYLYNEKAGQISNFGAEGEDKLFIGGDFTVTTLAADADLATERLGDSGALEIFIQQDGANTQLYFEEDAFGGSDLSLDQLTKVTLVGVNAEDVSVTDGVLTVA